MFSSATRVLFRRAPLALAAAGGAFSAGSSKDLPRLFARCDDAAASIRNASLGNIPNAASGSLSERVPLLLITDLGSDIDDTLALLTIVGLSESIHLVGVVTSGGHALDRAAAIRGWLRKLGYPDGEVAVAADVDRPEHPGKDCHVPDGFPTAADGSEKLSLHSSAGSLIIGLAKQYAGKLSVACIGPVTPLADALQEDVDGVLRRSLKAVLFQASVAVDSNASDGTIRVVATKESFNFREDMEASKKVLEGLQDTIPLSFLTKNAAYQVGITTADFREWTRPSLPNMSEVVRAQMNRFRETSPEVFYSVYGVPEDKRTDDDWFFNLKDDIVSRPYDPLVILLLVAPQLFELYHAGRHVIVGLSREDHGIPDASRIRDKLKTAVTAGLNKAQSLRPA